VVGLCSVCCARRPIDGRKLCATCRARSAESYRQRRGNAKVISLSASTWRGLRQVARTYGTTSECALLIVLGGVA
jgi:hypothetical protein